MQKDWNDDRMLPSSLNQHGSNYIHHCIAIPYQTAHRYFYNLWRSTPSGSSHTMLPACCWNMPRHSVRHIPLSQRLMTFLSLLLKPLLSLPPLTVFVALRLVSCCSSYWLKPTSGHKAHFPLLPVDLKPITPAQRVPKTYRHSADSFPLSQARSLHIDLH